ncbi:HU family DNA-binding protein [Nocardioides marmoribigeumensis]|jgi:DNA-binding protein HU-beta|uniref:DNA-binding protein HU-beta n=1 Tax=Nocardioides marmoribigeumensis TaxID=433649 RepID=A0ABU2C1I7_9ACTN|nr:HU family DNA-binding protein [Nocardioides marmoribigeumensis]MDR7364536.1 DNA-binding protein HU-beta [Nocardioides marmoribigeumensis]
MKKDELVQAIADSAGLEKADANRALDAVVEVITSTVASGERLQVPGLGTFEPRERNAREGRNPQTGETIQIAATTTPGFKAATAFKNAVAGS